MRKKVFLFLWIFLIVLLLAGIVVIAAAVQWNRSAKSDAVPVVLQKISIPETKVPLVKPILLSARIETPWAREAASAELTAGQGAQTLKEPVLQKRWGGWGKTLWIVTAEIQAYHTGKIPEGKLNILFDGGPKKQTVKLTIPAFQAVAVPLKNGELVLAESITEPAKRIMRPWHWFVIGAAVIVLILCWIFFRRKRHAAERSIPVWEHALQSIAALKDALHAGKTFPEPAVAALNDLVRNYLEVRFALRAEHQTTREFLEVLKQGGPLNADQTQFLKEFLSSSDLVKFARLPADERLFDRAAENAGTLVRSTAVTDEEKGEKTK